jgi:RND family efflux transporter MFP subunit
MKTLLTLSLIGLTGAAQAAATFDCLIEPTQTIELRSTVGGRIEKIAARRGDKVQKGQVLVLLESSAERATAESARYRAIMEGEEAVAQTKYEYAKRKYERKRDMHADKLMSGQERDDAEGEMRSAKAEVQLAQDNRHVASLEADEQSALLARRSIRAPFNGVVADQLMYVGEVIEPGDPKKPILRLAQLDPLRVHLIMPRTAFGKVQKGMRVQVVPELPAVPRVEGTVVVIDSLIDAASGTFGVFVEVPNAETKVPAGIKCRATVPIDAATARPPAEGG